jgi:cytochrome c oxidase subunit 1
MSLYLLTKLTGKVLSPVMKNIAVIVPHLWMIGLFLFSAGLMWGGLLGEPRRTNLGISYLDPDSPFFRPEWVPTTALALFGGVIMFSAAGLFFIVLLNLIFTKRSEDRGLAFPEYAVLHDEPRVRWLDGFRPWLVLMVVIIALAYIPALRDVLKYTGDKAPPYDPNNPVPLELYQKNE